MPISIEDVQEAERSALLTSGTTKEERTLLMIDYLIKKRMAYTDLLIKVVASEEASSDAPRKKGKGKAASSEAAESKTLLEAEKEAHKLLKTLKNLETHQERYHQQATLSWFLAQSPRAHGASSLMRQ